MTPYHLAACRGSTELFFPERGGDAGAQAKRAKAVCARCPIRTACLNDALDRREEFGIWGGKTEKERRRLLNKRRRAS